MGVPSRELTYPPKMAYLKMIFLFPRWDMLISRRVIFFKMGWWETTNQSNLKKWIPPCWPHDSLGPVDGPWDPHLAKAAPDVKTFTATLSRAPWCQAALQMWKLKHEGLQEDVTWWLPWNPGWFFAGGWKAGKRIDSRSLFQKNQGFRVSTNHVTFFYCNAAFKWSPWYLFLEVESQAGRTWCCCGFYHGSCSGDKHEILGGG